MDIAGAELSIRDWLTAAAAKQPAPGGGSVAALAGALAAAMGEMTLNYSAGRKGASPEAQQIIRENLEELGRARALLLELVSEDQTAFGALVEAREREQTDAASPAALAAAAARAIAVPQAIMSVGMSVLGCALRAAPHANRHLLSDLAVCCELALAAVRCGGHNVRVNLVDAERDDRERLATETEEMIARGVEVLRQTMRLIAARSQHG